MKKIAIIAAALFALKAGGETPVDSLLAAYVTEAVAGHPSLAAMQAMAQAESSRVRMASAWMNPELMLGVMSLPTSLNFRQEPMTAVQVGVLQQLTFPGKLKKAKAAQEARAASTSYLLEDAKLEIAARVTKAYYELAGDLAVREALLRGKRLNEDLVSAARLMLAAGMSSRIDLLKAQWESERWDRRFIENEERIASSRVRLAAAVGRSSLSNWVDPPPLNADPPELPPMERMEASLERTPMRLAERLEVQVQQARVRRAELDYYPDPAIAFTYGIRGLLETGADAMGSSSSLSDLLSLELRIPLPLFYRNNQKAAVAENQAMMRRVEAEYQSGGLQLEEEVRTLYEEFQAAYRTHELIRGSLLPRAEEIWKAALADYQTGRIPFMTVTDAMLDVIMQEMDLTMALVDLYKTKADLERWTGWNR